MRAPWKTPVLPAVMEAAVRVVRAPSPRPRSRTGPRPRRDEGREDGHGVGAAAHTRGDRVGEPAHAFQDLLARLLADDEVQVAHQLGEGVGTGHGAEQVVGAVDVGDPVAKRLVDGVLEGAAADGDGDDLGAEHAHAGDVERLAPGVLLAHVDHALQAEQGAGGGGGHAVLAGAGLGDDAGLAHALGEQGLAEHVVDLVRAGVVEVLAFEQDAGAAAVLGEVAGLAQGAGPPGVVLEQCGELGLVLGVLLGLLPLGGDLVEGGDERLGGEAAAEAAVVPVRVGQWLVVTHGKFSWEGPTAWLPRTLRRGVRAPTGCAPPGSGGAFGLWVNAASGTRGSRLRAP